jgi:GDP-mannose 6-dehydrogenase
MRIAVFGLGYVGSVTAVCLTLKGHTVWGVDKNQTKVRWIEENIPPINEPRFADHLKTALDTERLHVVTDAATAVANTDLAFICVGTPPSKTGDVYLGFVKTVVEEIDQLLTAKPHSYTIVVRSTVPAGTTEEFILPILSKGVGKLLGKDLRLCFNPEFLREGNAIEDFFNPPFTIIGLPESDTASVITTTKVAQAYDIENTSVIVMSCKEAELLKIICNTFHALKITFANEIGSLAAKLGVDPERLMRTFVQDTKLNLSASYLRPGFAFGGSCLPKDIQSLVHIGHELGLKLPLCEAILPSNEQHLHRALSAVLSHRCKVVGMVGLAFKSGTDDIRESPALWLARKIIDAGKKLYIYEPQIEIEKLIGANRSFLQKSLPEFKECITNWELLADSADVIIFTLPDIVPSITKERLTKPVIDLYRVGAYPESQKLSVPIIDKYTKPDGLDVKANKKTVKAENFRASKKSTIYAN